MNDDSIRESFASLIGKKDRKAIHAAVLPILRVARTRGLGHAHVVAWMRENEDKTPEALATILTNRLVERGGDARETVQG